MNDYIISVNIELVPHLIKFDNSPDAMRFMALIAEKKNVELNFIIQNNRIIQTEFETMEAKDVEDFLNVIN